ncbi:MAG: hypothetical protein NZZ41_03050 [Candidatus Dojkabacteria bacterium]|nr:hypothetical protein [Candidatus Dojkabacteria bacterium]
MKYSWFDKFVKEYFCYGMNYSTSENGDKKIIWYLGPFSFVWNVGKYEQGFWKIFQDDKKKQQ